MFNLEMKHYAVFAMFLSSLGTMIGGLEHGWRDALTPQFIGGMLGQIGTIVLAVFVGPPGGKGNGNGAGPLGSIDPRNLARVGLLALACCLPAAGVALSTPSCAHAPVGVTPAAQRAFQADQVVQRLGELQTFTINLQQQNRITLEDARTLVTIISGDARATPPITGLVETLRSAPAGWQTVAVHGWQVLKIYLLKLPELATWIGVLEPLIDPLVTLPVGGQQGEVGVSHG